MTPLSSQALRATSEPGSDLPRDGVSPVGAESPSVIDRERSALRAVLRLVAERAEAETKTTRARDANDTRADSEYQKSRQGLIDKFAIMEVETASDDQTRRRKVVDEAMAGEAKAKADFGSASRKIASEFDAHRERARTDHARAKAEADNQYAAAQKKAAKEHAAALKPINDNQGLSTALRDRLARIAAAYTKFKLKPELPEPTRENYARHTDPVEEIFTRLAGMDQPLTLLEGLIIPKMMKGKNEAWLFVVVIALCGGLGFLIGMQGTQLIGALFIGLAAAAGLRVWLVKLSTRQLERLYVPLAQTLADTDGLTAYCRALVDAKRKEALERAAARHEDDLKKVKQAHAAAIAKGEADRDERLRKINEVYAQSMMDVQTTQTRAMRDAVDAHDRRVVELKNLKESSFSKLEANYQTLKEQVRTRFDAAWSELSQRWRSGMTAAAAELEAVRAEVESHSPGWDSPEWASRAVPKSAPSVLRSGVYPLDLQALPDGTSPHAELMEGLPTAFALPAIRPFPAATNLLIEAPPEGRAAALGVLQAQMLRLLTSLPPGMVRFTIVDPIGIGRNFGAFMHLADFDPALVTNQVWTDPRQIEERLAELAAHMELVTQKYLRNEYASIEEYNAVAGEVAEAFRVLVVADFPAALDEKAVARLAAIASGGVPCGVLTLIAADPTRPMPSGFRLDDLRPHCALLAWNGQALATDDPDFAPLPLRLDPMPPAEFATRQIQAVGAAAKSAKRVEVPFDFIAPEDDAWWTLDSRAGIDVPLGKAGATKRQNLALGQGTSQHVLIAGRTGSGKSTLMHALITNLALNYSPDELELYLIDFKKGVEFKVYATQALPHASVVAIESEREFGISVLQRLDAEIKLRADKFREAGVQDVNGYRNTPGTPPLPRILLIVDEFQEFFVEEDKLASEAALLLDRLVRQGRAFGIHIHLGSQSLGGAFTLARSTLGQMSVRIALQCSEADSHLILAEQNPAARLLSRPGEAIYNDANGAVEGNHFFQVVWLSDERREDYLKRLRALAETRKPILKRTPIVFEGDAPADLSANPLLRRVLEPSAWPESPRSALAWLGDPVAIKEATAALFRRQAGNHLLIVGQNEEGALGATVASLLSLAAQFPPAASDAVRSGARFFVLDGTPEDHVDSGVLERVAKHLPHGVRIGGWRDCPAILGELGAELTRRQTEGDGPELFLFIHDLPRFRDLRKADDFSFSRPETAGPADHLEVILREGPGYGLHLIVWCDTSNNLNRYFANQVLREFAMRVLFQMSPNDSGALLDSPAASKLGNNRALFASEEQNRLEKFRPYGIPSEEWLRGFGESLGKRPTA